MKTWILPAAAVVVAALPTVTAHAETLKYTLSGPDAVTFYLDRQPTPTRFDDFKYQKNIQFEGLSGTLLLNGKTVDVHYNVNFYSAFNGGGIDMVTSDYDPDFGWEDNGYLYFSTDNVSYPGAQLYKGALATPTMVTGEFQLQDTFDFLGYLNSYTLNVSPVAAAVPEPSTWLSLTLGFGILGAALRVRRRGVAVASA